MVRLSTITHRRAVVAAVAAASSIVILPQTPNVPVALAFCHLPLTLSVTSRARIRQHNVNDNNPILIRRRGWFDNLFPKVENDETADTERRRQFPEQYPATYELSNEKVSGDGRDAALVRPLLKQTQLEKRKLQLVFDARKDGWSPRAFHRKVDGKGAAVVLATTKAGTIVGGYNPKGWSSLGGARPSVAAFLFYSIDNGGNKRTFQKLRKVGGGGLACAKDEPTFGISFGPDALIIAFQPGRERLAQSKLGPYYERGPDDLPSIFYPESAAGAVDLVDVRVLVGKYEPGEDIPYTGAVLDMTSG